MEDGQELKYKVDTRLFLRGQFLMQEKLNVNAREQPGKQSF